MALFCLCKILTIIRRCRSLRLQRLERLSDHHISPSSCSCARDSDSNMFLFLFLFGLALGAVAPSDDNHLMKLQRGGCPMFWYNFNGRCYKYVATDLTFADAELQCLSEGANLVSIHSPEEKDFVSFLIKNFDSAQGHTWIGLSDILKEGRWMWTDGSVVDFVFWHAGQPDNAGGNEHCGHIWAGTALRWNDHLCSQTFPSVCASRIMCPT
ncbi:lactose-binding lectin l-2-like isoform X1 [Sparus aurata]|uniref:lactose-binding lectin l-2-like isoform X1 n=1 Tax=Sparus aurata TaxID=8175 RepID=UPI0011C0CC9B|nr:lactose-binding lectin l-2-like isoform X1 [Sparus aurata]